VGTLDLARTDGQTCRQSVLVIQELSAIGDITKAGTDRSLGVGDASLFDERPQTFQNFRPAIVFQPVFLFLPSEIAVSNDLPPVWPWRDGNTRGVGLEPLYKNVPHAALRDPALYQLLALVDVLRSGRARERNLAERDLVHRLKSIHVQS
jgi:hypothetical protein